ncbi:MAG: AsmA family protein [Bacteroidetes bacterium]|nr:AsmA family protein [Bacteroidota bacterium]
MKKFLKRLAIILLVFFLLVIGTVSIIAGLFEERVGRTLTNEINKQLTAELTIEGFNLTVIRSFPNLSANLKGVQLQDSGDGELLRAEEIAFRFGLLSLLSSKYQVKSVVIRDGQLNVAIDEKGNPNYDIFKTDDSPAEEEGGASSTIDLVRAKLQDIQLHYQDRSSDQDIKVRVESAVFSGEFSSEQFTLSSKAQLISQHADLGEIRYLPNTPLSYDADIAVDLTEGTYELQRVVLEVKDNAFELDGVVEEWDNGTYFDLYATAQEGNLAGVLALLPATYAERLEGLESSGRFAFNAIVKGQANDRQNPEIRVEFSLDEGRLMSALLEKPLRDVSFNAVFTNGKYRDNSSSAFTLERFKAYFDRELVEMRLRVADFEDPEIEFFLDGVLPLETAYGLLGNPKITDGSGELEIKELSLEGAYADMTSPSRINRVNASGALEFDDAGLTVGEESLIVDRGELRLDGNRLFVNDLRLEGAGSDMTFRGSAFNLVPVLFADSVNSRHVQLEFNASLIAEEMDIDRLMQFSALTPEEKAAPEAVQDSIKTQNLQERELLTSFLNGSFNADIKAFNYEKIEGRDFKGQLNFRAGRMGILGEVKAFGGKIDLDGEAFIDETPQLAAKMNFEGIDVTAFFQQAENFGQEVLTAQHLEGQLDSKMAIYAYWDERGSFQMDKLRVLAGLGISDGRLKGFEMLEDFSSFVNINDLQDIQFVDMQNFLEIRNGRLYIPVMFIRSNALNMTISGEHSFENEVAYHIKVNAGQVLANRFKRHDPSLSPKPAKRDGWFNLYYAILGTLEDYNITSAKRRVQSEFELSEVRKRDIQRALEAEFGLVELIEEPEAWKDIPEYDHDTYDPEEEEYLDFDVGGGE